jgi:NDP-hexose 2,3-dehydratase
MARRSSDNFVARTRHLMSTPTFRMTVKRSLKPPPEWRVEDDTEIKHRGADFFRIRAIKDDHSRRLVIEQSSTALVFLLARRNRNGSRDLLLSIRSEPGLIGITNLTTTIQSTESNFRRQHGGLPTPFIDVALSPTRFGRVLHDSMQWDWGNFYTGKMKRVLIVETDAAVEAPRGFVWAGEDHLERLLQESDLITNDLRVALLMLWFERSSTSSRPGGSRPAEILAIEPYKDHQFVKLSELEFAGEQSSLPFWIDDFGTKVEFFDVESRSREINRWSQPLLSPAEPTTIACAVHQGVAGPAVPLVFTHLIGLPTSPVMTIASLERHLKNASSDEAQSHARETILTSAEGGRFFRHRILISVRATRHQTDVDDLGRLIVWAGIEQLREICSSSLQSALELRLALSAAIGADFV